MAEPKKEPRSIFSIESTQQLRIDIDGVPHAIRSMKEFRLKEQVAFQRDFQSVSEGWQGLFKPDAAPTEDEIDYVSMAIDEIVKKIVVNDAAPFLALTELQKLDVLGAFAGNASGASGGPQKDSSPASPASTELTRSA